MAYRPLDPGDLWERRLQEYEDGFDAGLRAKKAHYTAEMCRIAMPDFSMFGDTDKKPEKKFNKWPTSQSLVFKEGYRIGYDRI
jgi:hypothetical protein